jgi:hypothetical protein
MLEAYQIRFYCRKEDIPGVRGEKRGTGLFNEASLYLD